MLANPVVSQISLHYTTASSQVFSINDKQANDFSGNYSFNELKFNDFQASDNLFTELSIEGFGKSYIEGEPDLPKFVQIISVPADVELVLSITDFEMETLDLDKQGVKTLIKPAVHSISKSENISKIKYELGSVYNADTYSDKPVIELREVGIMRDIKLYELIYQPVLYNAVQQKIKVRNNVSFKVEWQNNSFKADKWNFVGEHTKPLTAASTTKSLLVIETYVIVSPSKYKETLQPFIKWKKQKGFHIIESYIGEEISSNNKNTIKEYLQDLYENPAEGVAAPSYLLIVGDVIDIPAWSGTTDSHVTDLYYAEYTGDFLPELYYGRFSAVNAEQLKIIVDKTLFVEKGSGDNFTYQNNHLLISGVDKDFAPVYGNGAIHYFLKYYSLEDFGITPSYYLYGSGSTITSNNSGAKQAILDDFSEGTGIAYYTAHCSSYGWSSPEFEISDIAGVNNKDKYPLMIGNCCQSLQFNLTSFGEEIVRAKDKGAVAYIGASDYSYWDEDYYWGVGFTSNIVDDPSYESTELGSFDAWFHTHNEAEADRAYTVGQILNVGNLAVQSSSSDLKNYYWEVYHIMGDPSLVPAKYQHEIITASYSTIFTVGQSSLKIETEANAIVSLMENGLLLAVGNASNEGICDLSFMPLQEIGEKHIELVVSLPNYSPLIDSLNVIAPDGPYLVFKGVTIDDSEGNNDGVADFGETLSLNFLVENFGTETAENTNVILSTTSEWIVESIKNKEILLGNIAAGELLSKSNLLTFTLKGNVPNEEVIEFLGVLEFGDKESKDFSFEIVANAPAIEVTNWLVDASGIGNLNGIIESNESLSLDVFFTNSGTAQVSNTTITFESSNDNLISVLSEAQAGGGFDIGQTKNIEVQLKAGEELFPGDQFDLNYKVHAGENDQYLYRGLISLFLGDIPEYNMNDEEVEIISAYFYDAGGPDNTYSNNESSVMTFKPHNANQGLLVDFMEFNVEPSATGCYDKLYIYDGINTNAPLLGKFCDNNINLLVQSQNSDGALTFKFTSDSGVVKEGWKAFISSENKHKVTLKITDGVNFVDSASVAFVNIVDSSDINGEVFFENILSQASKKYSISKLGYFDFNGTIGEINSDTSITVLMQKLPDICITVSHGILPLEGASVRFDDRTLITDANGYANFLDVMPGSKTFRVSNEGYNDTSGIIVVNTIDVCYNLKLDKIPTYSLNINIVDEFAPVADAEIDLNDVKVTTNSEGEATYLELYASDYGFTVSKAGYQSLDTSVNIIDSNVIIQLELKHITYSAAFNVTSGGELVENASVIIDEKTQLTNVLGVALWEDIIPASDISFLVTKTGFNDYSGTFDLIDDDVELDIELSLVGILSDMAVNLEVYPNPLHTSNVLNIKSNRAIDALKVFNYAGSLLVNKVMQPKEFSMDISDFTSGIYILQVKIGEDWYFEKVMVE